MSAGVKRRFLDDHLDRILVVRKLPDVHTPTFVISVNGGSGGVEESR